MEEFRLAVDAATLDDLDERLARTRFARPAPGPAGAAGTAPGFLRGLLSFTRMPRGGHFAAAEEPALVATDIRRLIAATG